MMKYIISGAGYKHFFCNNMAYSDDSCDTLPTPYGFITAAIFQVGRWGIEIKDSMKWGENSLTIYFDTRFHNGNYFSNYSFANECENVLFFHSVIWSSKIKKIFKKTIAHVFVIFKSISSLISLNRFPYILIY